MLSRRVKQVGRGQAGFTVLELLIACTLVMVLLIPLSIFTFRGLAGFQYLQDESNTSIDLSTLSERISKVVRGATSVITAQANTLTIYGYFSPADNVQKQIRYFTNGNELEVGVTPPSGTAPNYTYPAANEVVTVLRTDLSLGGNSLFTYYDDTGTQLAAGYSTSQVKEVGIYVAANPNTTQVNVPIAIKTRVTLRNFKTNL
jgi:type II secretory pathway pseudopilin PulG